MLILSTITFVGRFVDSSELVIQRDGDFWDVNNHLDANEVC